MCCGKRGEQSFVRSRAPYWCRHTKLEGEGMKLRRDALLALAVAAAVIVGTIGPNVARADNPRAVKVLTYNIYQGSELEHALSAATLPQFIAGVGTDYQNVVDTNFVERADALATEIAQEKPALVGLQEVATWKTQIPFGSGPTAVSYDFLQILLDALAAHGLSYRSVIARDNFVAPAGGGFAPGFDPALYPFGLIGVQLTERSAILARTDLPTDELQLSNPQEGAYQHISQLPTLTGPFPFGAGWLSVDAKVRGKTFRFITSHLDGFNTAVNTAQADEVLAGPAATDLPVVWAGDFNSQVTDPTYSVVTGAGFADEWDVAHPGDAGLTCCQVPPDSIVNPVSQLHSRIDYVFARGLFAPSDIHVIGDQPSSRTPSGLWPSDHAGLTSTLTIGPQADLTP